MHHRLSRLVPERYPRPVLRCLAFLLCLVASWSASQPLRSLGWVRRAHLYTIVGAGPRHPRRSRSFLAVSVSVCQLPCQWLRTSHGQQELARPRHGDQRCPRSACCSMGKYAMNSSSISSSAACAFGRSRGRLDADYLGLYPANRSATPRVVDVAHGLWQSPQRGCARPAYHICS